MALASRLRRTPGQIVVVVSIAWLALSVATGSDARMRDLWHRDENWLAVLAATNADPASCGLGIDPPDLFYMTGQVRLRADIPLYNGAKAANATAAGGYNRLVHAESASPPAIGAFRRQTCAGSDDGICLYARAGGCVPHPAGLLRSEPPDEVTAALHRLGLR